MRLTLARMPRQKKPPTETVRVPKELAKMATLIAAHQDKSVPDYLADLLLPLLRRDHEAMIDDLNKGRQPPPQSRPRPKSG